MVTLCIDHCRYTTKPQGKEISAISTRITQQEVNDSIPHIADMIGNRGQTFTPAIFHGSKRKKENFQSMQLFALDFDSGICYNSIADRADQYELPVAFAYKTFSYSESNEKFRIAFLLDTVITDRNIAEMILFILSKLFPEADPSCKDVSRMFFGGKGLISIHDQMCSLITCIKSFEYTMIKTDISRHFCRDMQNLARRYGIELNSKKIICIYQEQGDYKENGAKSANDYYIYKGLAENAPYFYLIQKSSKNPSAPLEDAEYTSQEPMRAYHMEKANTLCRLLRNAEKNIYTLTHDERFGLLSNLRYIDGGAKYFLSLIDKCNPDKLVDWNGTNAFLKREKYNPIHCKEFCRYCDSCSHKATLIRTLQQHQRFEILSPEPDYVSLDEAVSDLEIKFSEAMNADDQNIHVIEAQTAIGKTRIYCEYIQKNYKIRKFLIAVPTNLLKNEVAEHLHILDVPVCISPAVSELVHIDPKIKDKLIKLYDTGYNDEARRTIKKMLKKEAKKTDGNYKEIQQELQYFLNFMSYLSSPETRVIVTTHSMLLHLSNNRFCDSLNDYQLIIDEDIIPTICHSQHSIEIQDISCLLENTHITDCQQKQLEFLQNMISETPILYEKEAIYYKLNLLQKERIFSDFNNLRKGCILLKNKNNITYLYPYQLPMKKVVILSATSNEYIYRKYFSNRIVQYTECKKAKLAGHIYQYPFYNCSRNALKKKKIQKILSHIRKKHGDIPVISFKEYYLDDLHFGNTEGIDRYANCDIAVLGTPHLNDSAYKMLAFMIDHNVTMEKLCLRKVTHKNVQFSLMSYKNVLLQNIQKYFISLEIEQAVGRARALRYNRNVYVYSDFPVEQAEYNMVDYLSEQ